MALTALVYISLLQGRGTRQRMCIQLHFKKFKQKARKTVQIIIDIRLLQLDQKECEYPRCALIGSCNQKSNLSLYLLCHAEACNEFAGPISLSLRLGNTDSFEEMLQQWRAIVNAMSDFTAPRFEPPTSRSGNNALPLDQPSRQLQSILLTASTR